MAALWFYFSARNNAAPGNGTRLTGLKPTWTMFNSLDTNAALTAPTISEVGQGIYKYSYDPEANGDAVGQVDALGGVTNGPISLNPSDQYIDQFPTRESSRLLTGINSSGQTTLAAAGLDGITVEKGINARQALSPILASSAGVLTGAGTGTITIKGGNTSTTRITATTDSAGNRSQVTLNLPT